MTIENLMKLDEAFDIAVSNMGVSSWVEHFESNGIMLVKSGNNVIGRLAIKESMQGFFASKNATLRWKPEGGNLSKEGDLGYTYGTYIRTYENEQREITRSTGRYLTIWRRQPDESYLIELDMGN